MKVFKAIIAAVIILVVINLLAGVTPELFIWAVTNKLYNLFVAEGALFLIIILLLAAAPKLLKAITHRHQ